MYHNTISIHALLAESDQLYNFHITLFRHFYPRSPCGERLEKVPADVYYQAFLSTLSLRRATRNSLRLIPIILHFYPRSPCGERPLSGSSRATVLVFLSTLSLRRATADRMSHQEKSRKFLSTLSLRRATPLRAIRKTSFHISIHALLAESDVSYCNK